MPVHLYVAPAAAGKTVYVLNLVRQAARGLASVPRVCVPTVVQVRAWRRRLAELSGALGVRVLTFDQLCQECLSAAGEVYTELVEPVQYRLIRAVLDDLPLVHYAPLIDRPGFVQVLQGFIAELKAAQVRPEDFRQAVAALGDEPRLRELAAVYAAYQTRLQAHGWADRAGQAWLAVESLAEHTSGVARDWPLLVVDGFDNFTSVQVTLLHLLAGRVGELTITLTGLPDHARERPVHARFDKTRGRLEGALGVEAEPLPVQTPSQNPELAHLEASLRVSNAARLRSAGAVELIEAPDRAAEVRAALRWLKARLVSDGLRPGEVALLARAVAPYRPFIVQTAAEFGLPVRLVDGLSLRTNPAVAALLDLLRLALPNPQSDSCSEHTPTDENGLLTAEAARNAEKDRRVSALSACSAVDNSRENVPVGSRAALPRRLVVEAWRSPYFDWSALPTEDAPEPIGIEPDDARALDAAARWGRIIGGTAQWEEVLARLAARTPEPSEDEERRVPGDVPIGPAAQALLDKLRRFVQRLTPPAGQHRYRDFVGWLESLIGPDPEAVSHRAHPPEEPASLRVVERVREADPQVAEMDIAALHTLKDALRGLVWAEEATETDERIDFARFFADLTGVVEATSYSPTVGDGHDTVLVADVVQARGVPLRAVAVLGLAEGEFPATLREDPFLRDADRQHFRERNLPLEPSTQSAEWEYFYETVTRPRERLLLTRPRLADSGAVWQASPFWEEVRRLLDVVPIQLVGESVPLPDGAASWPELMESLAAHHELEAVREWVQATKPARWAALDAAAGLFRLRGAAADDSPFDGHLAGLADHFRQRFGPEQAWSASRLESYIGCPFRFFVGNVLGLEPRGEPTEGLDAAQLGTLFHRILERVYQAPGVTDPADLEQVLAALPDVSQALLDEAPRRDSFRETAWWAETRTEIEEKVRRSLAALATLSPSFVPVRYEARFGFGGEEPLTVTDGEDCFRLHGVIDRVDRDPEGRLRIIDYKTSGPSGYTNMAAVRGKKIQLSLYALAARDALRLGEPVEGFYWHVQQAEPSAFSLSGFSGGPGAALAVAVQATWRAVRGVRGGEFVPHPPDEGCPPYCPAVAFCWHYRPGFGG